MSWTQGSVSLEALSASVNKTRLACVFMTESLELACVCVCARVHAHVRACMHVREHAPVSVCD